MVYIHNVRDGGQVYNAGKEVAWERGDPVWTPALRPGLQADSAIRMAVSSTCRPGLLLNECPIGKGRDRHGCRSCCEMRGCRVRDSGGSNEGLGQLAWAGGWMWYWVEVAWERGDPVWTPELRPGLQVDSSI